MNKHMRLVVSVLFVVVILLAIAITRFYSDTSKNTSRSSAQTDIERRLGSDREGNRIFEDSSGFCGVIDSSDRVIVPAEWLELSFAGEGRCIASKRINGTVMKGCVDYEGNIAVPFIYRSITPCVSGSKTLYVAESGIDSSVVLYDADFSPMFRKVWTDCTVTGDTLTLSSGTGTYTYSASGDGFRFSEAEVRGEALSCGFDFSVKNPMLLERLDPAMLEYMASAAGKYLAFAYTGDGVYVSDIRTGGKPAFTMLFPDDKRIVSKKLLAVDDVYLYSAGSEDGVPVFSISVSAKTELSYTVEGKDEPESMKASYRAFIKFSGTSENDLTAVSGSFELTEPEYPEPEIPAEPYVPDTPDIPPPPPENIDGGWSDTE